MQINGHIASHGLINCDDSAFVRVRPQDERWPDAEVKDLLKDGRVRGEAQQMELSDRVAN